MKDAVKVLVVEGEPIIALHLEHKLEELGYEVVGIAVSGEAAVAIALDRRPDLVLMDIHLQGAMDGIEAARRIHEADEAAGIAVLFLTAYADDETVRRAEATLAFGYLIKPCDGPEISAAIRVALARREAEAAVEQRRKEPLKLALEAAALGVWEWEARGDRLSGFGYIDAVFGGVPDAIGEHLPSFLERVHPEDRREVQCAINRALTEGEAMNLVFRSVLPNGDIGFVETHARAYPAQSGAGVRLVGTVQDITERRRMEVRLRQAAVVFETTAEGIFILDAERRIVSVNPACCDLTDYTAEEILGGDPEVLLHGRPHSVEFYPRLESAPGRQWRGEIDYRHKDGRVFTAWESMSVVRDGSGRLTHYVASFSDISAVRAAEAELHRMAHHDPLTGLPNRILFNDRLDQALSRAARDGTRSALLFLDLDGFKTINDTLGHAGGDLLLKTVAGRIRGALRRSDTAARLGGDEFVVIMEDIERAEDGAHLAAKLLRVIGLPVELSGNRIEVSTSVGLSLYPDDGGDRHVLVKAADAAMYAAKAQGGNRYAFYTEALSVRAAERLAIEQGLRRAVKGHELSVHYQPQIGLTDGVLTAVEALVRWQDPKGGAIGPGRFIPIAEDSGIIETLGHFVLDTACREAAAFPMPLRLAVNVSARQLVRNGFEDTVATVLAATGFPAERLELEITESALQSLHDNREILDSIRSLGVRIAIDDFGTGYSSLSALKHLPIDRLKIDQSFVRDIPADPNDVAIVEAICALGLSLGLRITAEGIETREQLAVLRRLGCHEGQGYLFSRPLPAEALSRLAGEGRACAGFESGLTAVARMER